MRRVRSAVPQPTTCAQQHPIFIDTTNTNPNTQTPIDHIILYIYKSYSEYLYHINSAIYINT